MNHEKKNYHLRRYRHMVPGRVFLRSDALGKSFQSVEWSEYLEEHPLAGQETVRTSLGFDWNIFDICLNAKQVIDWKNKFCSIRVLTAKSPNNRYSYELHILTNKSSYSHGARFCNKESDGYDTEKAAVFDALLVSEDCANRYLTECMGREDIENEDGSIRYKTAIPYIKDCLKTIANLKDQFDVRQLELF